MDWSPGPGESVETRLRRLLKSLLSIKTDPSLRIFFLGRLGDRDGKIPELIDRVNHQTPGLVRYWDKSIHNPEYHGYMQNIDAVLPLIHDRSFYRLKITGAFNLAFAYRKPLLLSAIMKNNIDFQDNAFFYTNKDLGRVLSTPDKWLSAKYYTSEKWEFDFQRAVVYRSHFQLHNLIINLNRLEMTQQGLIKTLLFLLVIMISSLSTQAQNDVFGQWKSVDDNTGKVKSIVEIYKEDGKAFGRILELLDTEPDDPDPVCDKCKDHRKNQRITGMQIITGLVKDGTAWADGEILDPGKRQDIQVQDLG